MEVKEWSATRCFRKEAKVTTYDIDRLIKYGVSKLRDNKNALLQFRQARLSEREITESLLKALVTVVPEVPELPKPDELTKDQKERYEKLMPKEGTDIGFNDEILAELPANDVWIWYMRILALKQQILTGVFPAVDADGKEYKL